MSEGKKGGEYRETPKVEYKKQRSIERAHERALEENEQYRTSERNLNEALDVFKKDFLPRLSGGLIGYEDKGSIIYTGKEKDVLEAIQQGAYPIFDDDLVGRSNVSPGIQSYGTYSNELLGRVIMENDFRSTSGGDVTDYEDYSFENLNLTGADYSKLVVEIKNILQHSRGERQPDYRRDIMKKVVLGCSTNYEMDYAWRAKKILEEEGVSLTKAEVDIVKGNLIKFLQEYPHGDIMGTSLFRGLNEGWLITIPELKEDVELQKVFKDVMLAQIENGWWPNEDSLEISKILGIDLTEPDFKMTASEALAHPIMRARVADWYGKIDEKNVTAFLRTFGLSEKSPEVTKAVQAEITRFFKFLLDGLRKPAEVRSLSAVVNNNYGKNYIGFDHERHLEEEMPFLIKFIDLHNEEIQSLITSVIEAAKNKQVYIEHGYPQKDKLVSEFLTEIFKI